MVGIEEFLKDITKHFGSSEIETIRTELFKYQNPMIGNYAILNKWQMEYIGASLDEKVPGFFLFLMGYFGNGDVAISLEGMDS